MLNAVIGDSDENRNQASGGKAWPSGVMEILALEAWINGSPISEEAAQNKGKSRGRRSRLTSVLILTQAHSSCVSTGNLPTVASLFI